MLSHLVLILGVATAVLVPFFVGHGLAAGNPRFLAAGIGCLPAAAALFYLHVRLGRGHGNGAQHADG